MRQGTGCATRPRGSPFEYYHKEAEEYGKDFIKRHDQDLDTTLIFVSIAQNSGGRVLTRATGRLGPPLRTSLPLSGPPTSNIRRR